MVVVQSIPLCRVIKPSARYAWLVWLLEIALFVCVCVRVCVCVCVCVYVCVCVHVVSVFMLCLCVSLLPRKLINHLKCVCNNCYIAFQFLRHLTNDGHGLSNTYNMF